MKKAAIRSCCPLVTVSLSLTGHSWQRPGDLKRCCKRQLLKDQMRMKGSEEDFFSFSLFRQSLLWARLGRLCCCCFCSSLFLSLSLQSFHSIQSCFSLPSLTYSCLNHFRAVFFSVSSRTLLFSLSFYSLPFDFRWKRKQEMSLLFSFNSRDSHLPSPCFAIAMSSVGDECFLSCLAIVCSKKRTNFASCCVCSAERFMYRISGNDWLVVIFLQFRHKL